MDYNEFIASKQLKAVSAGFNVPLTMLNENAFEWQKLLVKWGIKKGKCAYFEDCGLGKTLQQLMWSDEIRKHTGDSTLILAPLAVAEQTVAQGRKFGIDVNICEMQSDVKKGAINITNYEKLHNFDCSAFGSVALDESSILKNSIGKVRTSLVEQFAHTPYKSCWSATPAPNDYMELGNHSEFLSIMGYFEMLATFFVHDGGNTSKWRLKGHAESKFWDWIASWAAVVPNPSVLGFQDDRYTLPELRLEQVTVKSEMMNDEGQIMLIPSSSQTIQQRAKARKDSLEERVKAACERANATDEQVLVWCDYNDESELLSKNINGAVEVKGSDSEKHKINSMMGFANGDIRALVSKPSICGYGMNWQNCHREIFTGLSDSFEKYYQALRRCYRFGQTHPVDVTIVVSEAEGAVKDNIERKQNQAMQFMNELSTRTKDVLMADIQNTTRMTDEYMATERMVLPSWIA